MQVSRVARGLWVKPTTMQSHTLDTKPPAYIGRTFERAGVWFWNNILYYTRFGLRDARYNPNVHGPYLPSRYYGPKDKTFAEVKVGELPAWLGRRQKGLLPTYRLIARAHARWMQNYAMVRHGGWSHVWQGLFILALLCYIECWPKYRKWQQARYHW
uniref:ATP synthase subunit f, mitochondrial n=1 Tax=Plectus sambesii TaxID=2011161 RepID=A0A914XJS5_9BILA